MLRVLLSLFIAMAFLTTTFAQEFYSIKGLVTDQDGKNILAGNVLVLSEDSSLIKGNYFWDGNFQVQGIPSNPLLLKIIALGYQDKYFTINNYSDQKNITSENIKLQLDQLDEVIVSAKKLPAFEQYGDRLVVNVENSSLSNSTSVQEILKKTPNVIVDPNGNFSVFGKGEATIFIDGKRIMSNEILDAISPNDLKQIEVVTNPSAKYEASGKAIINITTSKPQLDGFQTKIRIALTQATFLQKYAAVSVNYKKNKLNIYSRFATNPNRKEFYVDKYKRVFDESTYLDQKIEKTKDFKHRFFYTLGTDYTINSKSNIGFQYSGSYKKSMEFAQNENFVQYNTENNLTLETITNTDLQASLNSFNLSYNLNPDTSSQFFNLKLDHTLFDYYKNDDIAEYFLSTIDNFLQKRNYGNSNIGITTLQSNYFRPFNKLRLELETGLKYTNTTNTSAIVFDILQNNRLTSVADRTNGYQYNEHIAASYAVLKKYFSKWYLKAGIRVEHTNADGTSQKLNRKIVDNKYSHLFPSLSFRYDFSKDLDFSVSYSKRIKRPKIQELDPFLFYLDSLSFYQGNPLLNPEITHSYDLAITYMKYASIKMGYAHTINPMFLFVEQEQENSLVSIASIKNLQKAVKYFASINLPYQWKAWTTFNVVGVEFNTFNYQINGIDVEHSKPLWYFYFHNEFKLPKQFSFEVNYLYTTDGINGIFEFQPKSNLSFSVNKYLLNKKLHLNLSANDLFNKDRLRSFSSLNSLQLQYNSFLDNQYVRLNLRYTFGNLTNQKYKNKTANKEDIRRIKQ